MIYKRFAKHYQIVQSKCGSQVGSGGGGVYCTFYYLFYTIIYLQLLEKDKSSRYRAPKFIYAAADLDTALGVENV